MSEAMNHDRIKAIQATTGYPDSHSVAQALLQVWNETEQHLRAQLEEARAEFRRINVQDPELMEKVRGFANAEHGLLVDMEDGTGRTGLYVETGFLRGLLDSLAAKDAELQAAKSDLELAWHEVARLKQKDGIRDLAYRGMVNQLAAEQEGNGTAEMMAKIRSLVVERDAAIQRAERMEHNWHWVFETLGIPKEADGSLDLDKAQPVLSALAAARKEVEGMREALEWMLPIIQNAATIPSIKPAPETERVRDLGERFGYGAVMDAASALWVEVLKQKGYPEGGAFTPGLALGVAGLMLTRVRAALAPKEAQG